jgi:hypothetical protein
LENPLQSNRTVTLKDAVPAFPAASVALHWTTVLPGANSDPDAGTHVGVSAPSTSSVAEAVKLTSAPSFVEAVAVRSAGTVTTGDVASSGAKAATTALAASIVVVQVGSVPAQSPLQPAKRDSADGVATSVTTSGAPNAAMQVGPQSIPAGVEVTVPTPAPVFEMVSGAQTVKIRAFG